MYVLTDKTVFTYIFTDQQPIESGEAFSPCEIIEEFPVEQQRALLVTTQVIEDDYTQPETQLIEVSPR